MTKEELNAIKVKDIIRMPEFEAEMQRQIEIENDSYDKACREAAISHRRLKRTPVDTLRERDVFHKDMMMQLFEAVLNKALVGFSANERQYIYGIGMLCFGKVLAELRKQVEDKPAKEVSI